MTTMKPKKKNLNDRLAEYRQIKLNVVGRKSGHTISQPFWFIFREKYGAADVKKYYSKFDVAIVAEPV
jgi:hypothetical protein